MTLDLIRRPCPSAACFPVMETSSLGLGLPFDMARQQYANAVQMGIIESSMIESAKFARTLAILEKITLGPWARHV